MDAYIGNSTIMVKTELAQAGARIRAVNEEIIDELNTLAKAIDAVPDIWNGEAASGYQSLQAEWTSAAQALCGPGGILETIGKALDVNWNNFSDAESANVQTWHR